MPRAFVKVQAIVQRSSVKWHSVVRTAVLGLCHFLPTKQRLMQLLAMSNPDRRRVEDDAKHGRYSGGKVSHGGRRGLAHEDVSRRSVSHRVFDQLHRVSE